MKFSPLSLMYWQTSVSRVRFHVIAVLPTTKRFVYDLTVSMICLVSSTDANEASTPMKTSGFLFFVCDVNRLGAIKKLTISSNAAEK